MPYEDIHFQLVDLPAIAPEHPVPWIADTLQSADGCLLVVDLSDPACVEQVQGLHEVLRERRVALSERWEPVGELCESDDDVFGVRLPTLQLHPNRAVFVEAGRIRGNLILPVISNTI